MIVAEPGSGKTTSIRGLNPETTFVIVVYYKGGTMFPGWKKNYKEWDPKTRAGNFYITSDPRLILKLMQIISDEMPHINTIVIDDFQFVSAFEFMNRAEEAGFGKFNSIGKSMFLMATKPEELRGDLVVFYLTHVETINDETGARKKAKTIGKLVDDKISLEGLFSLVLFGKVKKTKEGLSYVFETVNNGENTCRSPIGMFKDPEIPNDLEVVRQAIVNYE